MSRIERNKSRLKIKVTIMYLIKFTNLADIHKVFYNFKIHKLLLIPLTLKHSKSSQLFYNDDLVTLINSYQLIQITLSINP